MAIDQLFELFRFTIIQLDEVVALTLKALPSTQCVATPKW